MLLEGGYVSESFDRTSYKFAFVRNPYDRAISLWSHLMNRSNRLNTGMKDTPFLEFCRILQRDGAFPIGLFNSRRWSQCNSMLRWTEHTKLDFIGRVEHFTRDMNKVISDLGLPAREISHQNPGLGHDRSVYCPESKRLVEEIYSEDFEAFGYPMVRLGDLTRRRTG